MKKVIVFSLFILCLGACTAPKYLPKPKEFSHHVKGLVLEVRLEEDRRYLGEIIEVNSTSIKLLTINGLEGSITTVAKENIQNAELIVCTTIDDPKKRNTWAGLINLISLSHSFVALISVPVNLISTTISVNKNSKSTYRIRYPGNVSWDEMKKFARFPQGIPDGIDEKDIK